MLEYAKSQGDLVEEVTKILRTWRPDIVMSTTRLEDEVTRHKNDNRMAAK